MRGLLSKNIALILALSFGVNLFVLPKARAVDVSKTTFLNNKSYNSLISDTDFISTNSMSVGQIQSFLESKGSFLKTYSEGGRSAAQIIWDAAHGKTVDSTGALNGIVIDESTGTVNPMVILVTLQKEQSLLSATTYNQYKLDYAMGFGCLESDGWNPAYKGFAKQVDWAAWQLRYNFHRAETVRTWATNYKVGQTVTVYNTNYPAISVTYSNRATASLYRYTPHVFNGNYNFWQFFNTYFDGADMGNSTAPVVPAPVTMSTYSSNLIIGTTCSMNVDPPVGTTVYNVPCPGGGAQKITIIRHKSADINGDGKVDLIDLSTFATYWGKSKPAVQLANLNPDVDEEVNLLDLSIMGANWGK